MTFNYFSRSYQKNKLTMGKRIRVLVARGLDILNFLKDIQNFIKDLPRIPKSILEARNDL